LIKGLAGACLLDDVQLTRLAESGLAAEAP